jgi:Domain of unknown function (DUF4153)
MSLCATLYICALVNFAAIIANYNVTHSKEASGQGIDIDICYLTSLGPQALPAMDKLNALRKEASPYNIHYDSSLVPRRYSLVQLQQKDMASWRSWSFRSWRLQRYLNDSSEPS